MSSPLPRTLLELHEISLDLEELTAIGQAPIVTFLLNLRFLESLAPFGRSGWYGYGTGPALALAHAVRALGPLEGIPPEDLDRTAAVLDAFADYETALGPGAGEWGPLRNEARASIGEARARLDCILEGSGPREPAEGAVGTLLVPVVARLRAGRPVHPIFAGTEAGQILRLRIEAESVSRRRHGGQDPILEGLAGEEVRGAFGSALEHLALFSSPGAPDSARCWFRVRWEPPSANLIGRSATLPFLLGAAIARAALAPGWSVREVARGVAASGDMDGTAVRPIARDSLPLKVRACFYSPARKLLIPFEQRSEGKDVLAQLEAVHPNRQLLLLGIRDALEAWNDPGTVATRPRTVGETCSVSFRRLVGSVTMAAAIPITVAILCVLIAFLLAWTRYDPVSLEWTKERDTLLLRNTHGWIVRRLPISQVGPFGGGHPDWGRVQHLADLDGDGVREVIAVHDGRDIRNEWLSAFGRNSRPLWTARAEEIVGGTGTETGEDLHWHSFLPIGRSAVRPVSIFAARRSRLGSLTIVDRRDPRTGRIQGMLRNLGHLESLAPIDLDGDGSLEICGLGTDNRSATGLLVVFDVARLTRQLPAGGGTEQVLLMTDPEALSAGVLAAFRFPKLRFGFEPRPGVMGVCRQANGLVVVDVSEGAFDVIYHLRFASPDEAVVESALLSDACRARLAEMGGGRIGDEDLAGEEVRLRRAVAVLTAAGWAPWRGAPAVTGKSEGTDRGN